MHAKRSVTPYVHALVNHFLPAAVRHGGVGKFSNTGVEKKNHDQVRVLHRSVQYGRAVQQIVEREHRMLLARAAGQVRRKRKYDATKRRAKAVEGRKRRKQVVQPGTQ